MTCGNLGSRVCYPSVMAHSTCAFWETRRLHTVSTPKTLEDSEGAYGTVRTSRKYWIPSDLVSQGAKWACVCELLLDAARAEVEWMERAFAHHSPTPHHAKGGVQYSAEQTG